MTNWENILTDGLIPPEIPADILPGVFREYAAALASNTGTPETMVTLGMISIVSTIVNDRAYVSVTPDYSEPLNTYTLVVMKSGSRKSAVLKSILQPLVDIQEEFRHKKLSEYKFQQSVFESNKQTIANMRRAGKSAKEIAEKEKQNKPPSALPRFFRTDITVEALAKDLNEQNGRMAIISDEGGAIDVFGGLYTRGDANIDILLKGWDGGHVSIKRQEREYDMNASLCFLLIVQPVVLDNMLKKSAFSGKGFVERFLFAAPQTEPDSVPPSRQIIIPPQARSDYDAAIRSLHAYCEKLPQKICLHMSDDAMRLYDDFYVNITKELRITGRLGSLGMESWGSKLRGQVIRLAGILQMASGDYSKVTAETMQKAIRLCYALMEHVAYIFSNGYFADTLLNKVWQWIKAKAEDCARDSEELMFKRVDLAQALKRYGTASEIDLALSKLHERNIIKKARQGKSVSIYINPAVLHK